MGFGFFESVYENCVMIELRKAGLRAEAQKGINVYYENEIVGEFFADIVVEDLLILELKSVRQLSKAHEVQLVNYLVATGKDVGLLLHFGESGVEVKRKVRDLSDLFNPAKPETLFRHAEASSLAFPRAQSSEQGEDEGRFLTK